jgi:hypothetical protein
MPKKTSETFGNVRKSQTTSSENFRTVPNLSEKTPDHTMTVRDVAKAFENKGVSRTERSIINWCHPNRHGIPRLDCYFEVNDNKYFITPLSVERVIAEERNKQQTKAEMSPSEPQHRFSEHSDNASERFGNQNSAFGKTQNLSEDFSEETSERRMKELEMKNRDLEVNNRVKDIYIERLEKSHDKLFEQVTGQSHRIGELEATVRILESPDRKLIPDRLPARADETGEVAGRDNGRENANQQENMSPADHTEPHVEPVIDTNGQEEREEGTL